MDTILASCCGLDVHKRVVVACLRTLDDDGRPRHETRTFGTMTADLLALADWLALAVGTGLEWNPDTAPPLFAD